VRWKRATGAASGPVAAGLQPGAMAIISSGGQKAVNRRSPISPCFAGRIIEWFTKAAGRSYAEKTSG